MIFEFSARFTVRQGLDVQSKCRKWGPESVREVSSRLALGRKKFIDPTCQLVERVGNSSDFRRAGTRDPRNGLARRNRVGQISSPIQVANESARDKLGCRTDKNKQPDGRSA